MSDEQKPELTWEEQQQAERDAETRRQVQIQLDETEKHLAAKKAKDLGALTDEQLRRLTRQWGYDAI
jgi:hypothetical protein